MQQNQINLIKSLIELGLSQQQIADKIGRNKSSLSEFMKRHGLKTVSMLSEKKPKIIKEKKPKIVILSYDEMNALINIDKLSLSQIARKINKNVGCISVLAKKYGLVSHHNSMATKIDINVEEAYGLYINGSSLCDLSERYGNSIKAIKNALLNKYPDIKFRTREEVLMVTALNDEQLLLDYAKQKTPLREIAKIYGVQKRTVRDAYRRICHGWYIEPQYNISKEDIEKMYKTDGMTMREIADVLGIKSEGYMSNKFIEFNIGVREQETKYEQFKDSSYLIDNYVNKNKSANQIAHDVGVSVGTVVHFIKKFDIKFRSKAEVYNLLLACNKDGATGIKAIIDSKFGKFMCDSQLEADFLTFLSKTDYGGKVEKNYLLENNGHVYLADFKLDNELIEVKPLCKIKTPGVNRIRLIKQILIAKKCGYDIKIWSKGDYYNIDDVKIIDSDIYYCSNWKLIFDNPQDCSDWLISYGFKSIEWPEETLYKGVYKSIDISNDNILNSNFSNVDVVNTIKHFSPHFWNSTHKGYNCIASIWEAGNHTILKNAVEKSWDDKNGINIYKLVNLINKHYKDFTTVSIFKPWIARFIYDTYLPNGGTIIDPCMGWGGRLMACQGKYNYIGYDININSVESNKRLAEFMNKKLLKSEFIQADSSIVDFKQGDLLFTSPPYDGTELYHGVDSKNTITDPIYNNIFNKFNGIVALNIPLRHEELCKSIGEKFGYKLINRHEMKTASFMGRDKTYEPILVFKKSI